MGDVEKQWEVDTLYDNKNVHDSVLLNEYQEGRMWTICDHGFGAHHPELLLGSG